MGNEKEMEDATAEGAPSAPADQDDDYNLVGGTLPMPSAEISGPSGADNSGEGEKAEASRLGLFDDLVPTREELAVPQGPFLPTKAAAGADKDAPVSTAPAADDLDMFG